MTPDEMASLLTELRALLGLPRGAQPAAALALAERFADRGQPEAWNTRFGPGSLFDAWTKTSVCRAVHESVAASLRPRLDARPGWRLIEVGGGDGSLWRRLLRDDDRGELLLFDPVPEVHEVVGAALPPGVALRSVVAPVEERLDAIGADAADAIVCSLTLHHLAGRDALARAEAGLSGPGKLEVLRAFAEALRPGGALLLVEADVHCDLELASGEPLLAERLTDSYVRRCARSLADDLLTPEADADLRARWAEILLAWCLAQVERAALPVAERDVYELDVPRWRALLADAGFALDRCEPSDQYGLFWRYEATAS